jgi:Fe-S oxidoreductase
MAGSFGYAREHYDVSRQIGERRLLPAARKMGPDDVLVASGTSCRQQVAHFTGVRAVHPAVLLRSLIARDQRLDAAKVVNVAGPQGVQPLERSAR